ncbi:MAG TPA: TonB-dependent receptor [Thermoanaerobaculia bacterium]|nr:TonB-dependent receptor [Thermoanaerobaculia bacterium]
MVHRVKRLLAVASLFLLGTGVALAQGRTTSALTGTVTDDSGAPLPGVTVEIRGEALIGGARVDQTDNDGRFRFPEIPPGRYDVAVSLEGFRPVRREGVALALGATADIDVKLTGEGLAETVEVVAEAPVIDTSSAATFTNLTDEYLQNLPTARFQPDVLNLAPGINLDSAFGGGESSANAYQIDGVDVSDPDGGTPWAFVNYNIIQEAQLVGLGAPAEYGGFTGVVFNSVTRSGGNQVKGMAEFLYTDDSLTDENSDVAGLSPSNEQIYDITLQAGGPIRQDKLWYFLSGQYLSADTSDGGPIRTERDPRAFGKLSWQVNQSHSVESWLEWDRFDITGRGGDAFTPLEATVTEDAPEVVWNLTDRAVLSPDTILNVAFAGYDGYYYLDPAQGYDIAGRLDATTGTYNTNSYYFFLADRTRNQLNASVSHYASDFIKGDHDFKFGMEVERSTLRNRYGYTTGVWFYDNYYTADDPGTADYDPVSYSLAYSGGGYDLNATNERVSAFVQDTWRIAPRLTLNPGVRFDLNRGSVTGGEVFDTAPIAPRIGFAWDVNGNGKTLVKGHYGRFYEGLFGSFYYWMDPGAFESGEIRRVFPSGHNDLVSATAGANYAMDSDIKHPYLDQFILGIDRELVPGITLSLTGVLRENADFIETVSRDGIFVPVEGEIALDDPVTGEPVGTGRRATLFEYLNPGEDVLLITNPSGLERSYEGVIVTLTRRLKDNWQMLLSYVYSKSEGTTDNQSFSSTGGGNAGPSSYLDTPNSLVNWDGRLSHDQTHQVKLQGSYLIPRLNLALSGNYTYHTGDTWTPRANCLLTDPDGDGEVSCHSFAQGAVRYFAEPRGSRRLEARNELDLRGEWKLPLGTGEMGFMLDVFNVTNQGRADAVEDRDGPNLGAAQTSNFPRSYRLGVRYNF